MIPPSRIFNGQTASRRSCLNTQLTANLRFEDPYGSFGMANPFRTEYVGDSGASVPKDVPITVRPRSAARSLVFTG